MKEERPAQQTEPALINLSGKVELRCGIYNHYNATIALLLINWKAAAAGLLYPLGQ